MPIEVDSEILILDRDEFHLLAHRILGIAFDVHNEFGRLLDESIYKRAIALRCAAAGILPARQEVQITVRFEGFEKQYFMDSSIRHQTDNTKWTKDLPKFKRFPSLA